MTSRRRISMVIGGIVQGVGFRPFVYRLACRLSLTGWVRNTGKGVLLEVEGEKGDIASFCRAIKSEAPPLSAIASLTARSLPELGGEGFAIFESENGEMGSEVSPDCDVCDDCLAEMLDPRNRRFLYPFINCTNCGPRYSIITGTPYDRPATTMAPFAMCADCLKEYHDPADRRFHAQPNACPVCGPRLTLSKGDGRVIPGDPLTEAISALREGKIVAVKGTGGFHLAVDACNLQGVAELRRRKRRDQKPFALLAPNPEAVRRFALCSEQEERLLLGSERPIVLLKKRQSNDLSPLIAPGNGWFGVMLPSTPLQHLLLEGGAVPLVMTSGNISDDPIAHRNQDAFAKLSEVADLFLSHDREIHSRSDDSVVRVFRGEPLLLRRSRGFTPRGVNLPKPQAAVLAVGAELKGALCLTRGGRGYMSQHLGDLKNAETLHFLEETVSHLGRLLGAPEVVAHDLHPDYLSTAFARQLPLPRVAVQHHHAHMASCMAENALEGEVIGVILDGTGYGLDGAVWGGEFLVGGYREFTRCAHLSYLRMPGGDAAVKEPYRMALAALYRIHGERVFDQTVPVLSRLTPAERKLFLGMLERGINSPLTSSCGRLFDAVAALLGVRDRISYEGQAAIELEALAEGSEGATPYRYRICEGSCLELDLSPAIAAICEDAASGRSKEDIALAFHLTLAAGVHGICSRIKEERGIGRVVLSGGVFQNRLLTEEVSQLLDAGGFQTYFHRLVPPNDGGVALGQAVVAGRRWACQSGC